MRTTSRAACAFMIAIACVAPAAQEPGTFDGRPVRILSNDKLSLALRSGGGALGQLRLEDDAGQLNPFEGLGHFVCVDGFGPVSKEEEAAGLPGHGEAHRLAWDVSSSERKKGTLVV